MTARAPARGEPAKAVPGQQRARAFFRAAFFLSLLSSACSQKPSLETTWLVVGPGAIDVDWTTVKFEGPVLRATIDGSKLVVELDASKGKDVTISASGACPLRVTKEETAGGGTLHRSLSVWLDFGGARAQAGFGAPLRISVRPGCEEAAHTHLEWKQTAGVALHDVHVAEDGHEFSATMPALAEALGHAPPWGVVPLSPRTRGTITLEATITAKDGRVSKRTIRVSAAARAHGLPNVALGTRVYLGGDGWHVVSAPQNAHAGVEHTAGATSLSPDARGTWVLSDQHGRALRLSAAKYDETPLDCGRSDCHAGIAARVRSNPMTSILERGLDAPFGGEYPACALACHAEGEPGLDDGGFVQVMHELGRTPRDLAHTGWHDLPAALRRLGGVGCLACHGPGAVPEASSRYLILSADVCATCHDAPPTYGHVAAWRTSRMAASDRDPRVRDDASCAGCHTTWGFLGTPERKPPLDAEPAGIACAACHAVHPEAQLPPPPSESGAEALLRDVRLPPLFAGALSPRAARSQICIACHAPSNEAPSASAAAIWAARGGLDPKTGTPLTGASPHGEVDGGCVGCHRTGPSGLSRGGNHAFVATRATCTGCHAEKPPSNLRARAEALWARFAARASARDPLHATKIRFDRTTERGRAAWDVALVLEDPAADAHNAAYATLLLDAASRALHGDSKDGR